MSGDCKPCAARARQNKTATFRVPAGAESAAGASAGSTATYEVVSARGTSTGRRFTSLVAATQFAQRIGGTTRPV